MMKQPDLLPSSKFQASGQPLVPPVASERRPLRYRPLPRGLRLLSGLLLPVYALTSLPGYLLAEADEAVKEVSHAVAASLQPGPPVIQVNRTLPVGVVDDGALAKGPAPGSPIAALPFSSSTPKDAELFVCHLFAEPLVPTGTHTTAAETTALARALAAYAAPATGVTAGGAPLDAYTRLAPISAFLTRYPSSRWALSLWLNVGLIARQNGYWSRALDAWEQAWSAGKLAQAPDARALADRALAELAELNARLGRSERLSPLLAEVDAAGRVIEFGITRYPSTRVQVVFEP